VTAIRTIRKPHNSNATPPIKFIRIVVPLIVNYSLPNGMLGCIEKGWVNP